MARTKKDLQAMVEKGITDLIDSKEEPSDGRIKALALGVKMVAIKAKLEESDYGDYFREPGSSAGDAKGKKPSGSGRANGADDTIDAILNE